MIVSNFILNDALCVKLVEETLCIEETRRNNSDIEKTQALVIKSRGRSKYRGWKGHKSKEMFPSINKFKYFHCGKEGWAYEK